VSKQQPPVDPGVALEKQPVESVLVVEEAVRCCPVPGMEQVVEAVLASGSGGALPQPRDSAQQVWLEGVVEGQVAGLRELLDSGKPEWQ